MKEKYLKGITALGAIALLFFSSCLKDARYFQPESVQSQVAYMPLSGLANFSADAITKSGIDTITFAVSIAAFNPLSAASTVTLAVDNTIVTTYNTANPGIAYQTVPATSFKLVTPTVTIPAGKNSALATVIVDRTGLDPSLSYMLPIKIANTSPSVPISANSGVHYYHIIGNDFAGTYKWEYKRFNGPDTLTNLLLDNFSTAVLSPVSPTEFTMETGYNGNHVRYDVTFTKTIAGGVVSYSNWNVAFVPSDLVNKWAPLTITNTVAPKFVVLDPVKKTFRLTYQDFNGASFRSIIDMYFK
jgi:hypothetical protein